MFNKKFFRGFIRTVEMTFFVNIWLNVSKVVLFVWFIVKLSLVKKIASSTILLTLNSASANSEILNSAR